MSWKDIKCKECGRDIGCPNCGQILPDLGVVTERVGDKVFLFCSLECRNKWKEKQE